MMKKATQFLAVILAAACVSTTVLPQNVSAASWKKSPSGWWYQEDNGSYPKNQWKKISSKWYWFDTSGYMVTGWKKINGNWYYFQSDGAMLGRGWHKIGSHWYYMYKSGIMASNTWIGDDFVDANGIWFPEKIRYQEGWVKSGSRWWYRHADGSYTKNGWERINGCYYLFDKSGYMLTGWQKVGGNWYYLRNDGAMFEKGWHKIGNNYYYMYASGAMAKSTWIGEYYVNASGIWCYTKSKDIPANAVEYKGHYYQLYPNNTVSSYDQALQYCKARGGYLATLTSKEENDFVFNYMKSQGYSSAYFGLTDASVEGTWKWSNGETVSYTNWHKGEPNGENSREDYAQFYWKYSDGSWNDGDFGGSTSGGGTAFICEWGYYTSK